MGDALEPALNAFLITFGDRVPGRRNLLTEDAGNTVSEPVPMARLALFRVRKSCIDHLHGERDRITAFCSYRGTHLGEFLGIPATGRTVQLRTANIQCVAAGHLAEHWELVDMQDLLLNLGAFRFTHQDEARWPRTRES